MGAGKTTLGRLLADACGLDFIDLDSYIEARHRKSVGQLFEERGETGFREIESAMLKEVAEFENVVVSTGGGAPCFFDNMNRMNRSGITVYLKASPEILAKRLNKCKDKRPLLKDKGNDELLSYIAVNLKRREPFYSQASVVFDTEEADSESDFAGLAVKLRKLLRTYSETK
jgi:shikimate kinase